MLPHGRPCDRCLASAQRTAVKQVFARNDSANPRGVHTRSCWWGKDGGSSKHVPLAAHPTVKACFRLVPLSHIDISPLASVWNTWQPESKGCLD